MKWNGCCPAEKLIEVAKYKKDHVTVNKVMLLGAD